MRRIIFCPSEFDIPEASVIAKKTNLPINIGMFEQIEHIAFDKTKIQVIEVPEIKKLSYNKKVKKNFHQNVVYQNDFISLNKSIILKIDNIEYSPILCEKHKVNFLVLETVDGIKNCDIMQNNNKLESFNYEVN
jgi:hypothetical protein